MQLTTAGTANTAEKQELTRDCPITCWVIAKKTLKLKLFAVPAVPQGHFLRGMFAVVELRF